jgi:hypothetical protein
VGDDESARQQRAEELREEIERLRSGEAAERPPKSPREFVEQAAREDVPDPEEDHSEEG